MLDGFEFSPGLNERWREAVDAHKAHAEAEWPREACGLIDKAGQYHACTNGAAEPLRCFSIPKAELIAVDGGRPAALLHSHTSLLDLETGKTRMPLECPSAADMRGQIAMAIPWGISTCIETGASDPFWFGDQVDRPPLWGRRFRHGVDDCYSLIRDWHKQVAGITIPDFPRDPLWWEGRGDKPQQDLYAEGFAKAGFERKQRDLLLVPGDVFLCAIHSPVMNHGGVYVAEGVIGHHLTSHASMRRSAAMWAPRLDFIVRHKDLPDDWRPRDAA